MKTILTAALVSLLAVPVLAQAPQGPSLIISPTNRTISVSATDHAEADAEVAELKVGYVTYGPTLQATYKSASDTSAAIVKSMIDAGARKDQIQSHSQRVSRLSDYEIKTRKGMQFSVVQSWTVSVEPKLAALILDAAVQAGANQSGDINWRMKNGLALDAEAIQHATERAHAIAVELAHGVGATLGKPLFVTNSVSSGIISPRFMVAGAMEARSLASQAALLTIEAQRVESTATVQIIYAIE